MTRLLRLSALLAAAATAQAQPVTPFSRGEVAPNVQHVGTVWLNELVAPDSTFDAVTLATFAPGARLDWHTHPGGQALLVTEGEGYVQQEGGPVQTVRAGDVVRTPPGVKHWHSATPEAGVVYLAITQNHPDGRTVWAEPVTGAEYAAGAGGTDAYRPLSDHERWLLEQGARTAERAIRDARREHGYQSGLDSLDLRRYDRLIKSAAFEFGSASAFFVSFAHARGIEEWDPDDPDPHPLSPPLSGLFTMYGSTGSLERHVRLAEGGGGDWDYVEQQFGWIEESIAEVQVAFGVPNRSSPDG